MKLDTEFYRLPLRVDTDRLKEEVEQFSEEDWRPHPQGHAGNSALALVAVNGDPADDSVKGRMQATPHLARCPYMQQVLASLQTVVGRTRLMRIEGHGEATPHIDTNYYWMQRVRVHVPVITTPEVEFVCNDRKLHMAAGGVWVFNTWHRHNVVNPTSSERIHLVIDTVGSSKFWDLIAQADRPLAPQQSFMTPVTVPWREDLSARLEIETVNYPIVMSPWELQAIIGDVLAEMTESEGSPANVLGKLDVALSRFQRQWRSLWASHGENSSGWREYELLLDRLDNSLKPLEGQALLANGVDAVEAIRQGVVRAAHNPELAETQSKLHTAGALSTALDVVATPSIQHKVEPVTAPPGQFDRPVFIVAAPRSGSTLLFETLAQSSSFWTVGGESHQTIEQFSELRPESHEWDSNRLSADDATPDIIDRVRNAFHSELRNRDQLRLPRHHTLWRMLEKTPKNCLRIPFLKAVFPEARFIFLHREPRGNISSIIDAWESGRFVTYPRLPDSESFNWSLVLVNGWRELIRKPLAEIATEQWLRTNTIILNDLKELEPDNWCTVSYQEFLDAPNKTVERLCRFAGVAWDRHLSADALPHSRYTLTPPEPDKWRKNEADMNPYLESTDVVATQVANVLEADWTRTADLPALPAAPPVMAVPQPAAQSSPAQSSPTRQSKDRTSSADTSNKDNEGEKPSPLRSVHTTSLPKLLNQLGISVLISTYQAGRVVTARAEGDTLNTHFSGMPSPMGMAYTDDKLAIGTKHQVWVMRNMKSVAQRLGGHHDSCFLPQSSHVTGDIRIHEIAWANNELWIVNTRFSCLCTLDNQHSFVPRWKPQFITALKPEDRCHLNGLALQDNQPRYVTALGTTDSADGWRDNKAFGGCLMDVTTGETIAGGLSMPHSPRWHDNRLWVLESGAGSLATVDLQSGSLQTVAEVPGFTRGLDFYGPFAFIGLSQVRESSVFSGLPITERVAERSCGMWVVDTRNGQIVAFLRFDDAVQEVFAIQVLPHRFPELRSERENSGQLISNSFHVP